MLRTMREARGAPTRSRQAGESDERPPLAAQVGQEEKSSASGTDATRQGMSAKTTSAPIPVRAKRRRGQMASAGALLLATTAHTGCAWVLKRRRA